MTIKKYILLSLGISIFILLAIIFFATFPFLSSNHQDIEIPKVSIENDIEEYLRIEESKISNIAPNAKKKIIWNNSDTKEKTEYAFVFLLLSLQVASLCQTFLEQVFSILTSFPCF